MNREMIPSKKCYGAYENVWLNIEEVETFRSRCLNSSEMIEALSKYKFDKKKEYVSDFAVLLTFGRLDGEIN